MDELLNDPNKRRYSWMNSKADSDPARKPRMRKMTLPEDMGLLDAIGYLSPKNWYWDGRGFYDNRPGTWASFP